MLGKDREPDESCCQVRDGDGNGVYVNQHSRSTQPGRDQKSHSQGQDKLNGNDGHQEYSGVAYGFFERSVIDHALEKL